MIFFVNMTSGLNDFIVMFFVFFIFIILIIILYNLTKHWVCCDCKNRGNLEEILIQEA